jgi:putative ABC transport system permease protein
MSDRFPWTTAAKIAWRESRSSPVKFAFVVLAVAIGVGSLTGVRGFASAFQQMLVREARTLMAADVTARIFVMPTEEQEQVIAGLVARGVRETQITETLTMVSAPSSSAAPVLVSAKAVDPAVYPFYGQIKFDPPGPIREVLTPETVAMAPDLMLRLEAKVGDTIRLGGQDYRLAAAVVSEPDRMSGSLNIGPRLMLSREALARTGLLSAGSRAAQRFLFKLGGPGSPTVEAVRTELKAAFPDAQVIDYRETHPIITRGLERSTTFLSMVSLIALIVGALGVATAMHAHLQQKLDSIAVMKCLGARSKQIIRIYLIQTLGLGLAGGLLGVAIGALVQLAFPLLIARYFQIETGFVWDWPSILQGLAAGVLSTLLFTLPPLLSIREIRPNLILRREMADANPGFVERLRRGRASILAGVAILAGMAGLAAWLSAAKPQDAIRLGAYFVAGIVVTLASLMLVAMALLGLLRRLLRARGTLLPASWRHGFANLYRPGNQARAILVAMGLGVMFTATIYLIQRSMLEEIAANAPPGMPNVFLLDIQPAQRDDVVAFVNRQRALEKPLELVPSVAARLTAVNGTPVEQLNLQGWGRRFRQTRTVTWSNRMPESTEIVSGKWFAADQPGQVSIAEDAAKVLNIQPGAKLDFVASGAPVSAEVVAIHRTEAVRVGATSEFIFTESSLKDLPVIYYGGLRLKPSDVGELQTALYKAHPTVTVVNVADVIQTIQEVVDQIALVVRFISAFAILAGVIILASSVAGTRFRRIREVVILKTLGGTRRQIGRIFSIEFFLLGATAGLMGGLLASGFANVIFVKFFKGDLEFDPLPVLVATAAGAILANLAGWAASARILGAKPLEVLRAE